MRVNILASGSTGNASVVEIGGHRFLVDAGISCKHIEFGLMQCGYKGHDLSGVLITHEHSDHIKGLDVLVRRYRIPVFTREKTWQRITCRDKLPEDCVRTIEDSLTVGGIRIEAFNISHDAADPVGFTFFSREHKCTVVTDFGVSNAGIEEALQGADVAVVESNHDLEMLQKGPYPWYLKERIRSQQGHLSNHDSGLLLSKITDRKKPLHAFLAHLSQENNRPGIAEQSVNQITTAAGIQMGKELILHMTYPDRISSLQID